MVVKISRSGSKVKVSTTIDVGSVLFWSFVTIALSVAVCNLSNSIR